MQTTATINECAIQLSDLPPKLKPHDIFPQILAQFKVNILGVLMASDESDIIRFDSKRCFSLIEQFVIKSNQHLVTGMPQYKKSLFDVIDKDAMEAYEKNPAEHGIISGKKRFIKEENKGDVDKKLCDMENKTTSTAEYFVKIQQEINRVLQPNECVLLAYDDLEKTNDLLTKDIWINKKLAVNNETKFQETFMKKVVYSKKNLLFRGCNQPYLDFDIGVVQKDPEEPESKVFRTYWSLENLKTYGCHIGHTRVYFPIKNFDKASLSGLLTLDLVFQVEKILELRVSIDFDCIDTYTENGKVYWALHLVKHPSCYFYPLKADEYLAFHLKNWRRTTNFLLGDMPDNIDRLYLGHKSIMRLCFDQEFYKKSLFIRHYEKKLFDMQQLNRIQPNISDFIRFSDITLKFNSQMIEQARVPFDIKFIIMIMISRAQVDVCTLPDVFLEKLWRPVTEKKTRSDIIKRALEMIMLNKKFDKKFMTYEDFKVVLQKYLKVVKYTEKIMDNTEASKNKLTSFDANLYSFEVQISPSCMYYLSSDLGISKAVLYEFPDYMERFLLVKFIDENLEPMKTIRSVMRKLYYRKYLKEIKLFNRNYEFLCFQISQLESRAFWAFSPDKNLKSEDIFKFLEARNPREIQGDNSDINLLEHMMKTGDEFGYSYDTLDVKDKDKDKDKEKIKIKLSLIPSENETEENQPRSFEGFISSDILEENSKKFRHGNVPGIVLRSHGQSFLLIRDPDLTQKKTIRFFQGTLLQPELDSIQCFEIIDIPRYRPAFLNRRRIVLFESLMRSHFSDESEEFLSGINTFLRRFIQSMQNPEQYKFQSFNRVVFGSKFSNNAVKPVMSAYNEFDSEEFFSQLNNTIQSQAAFELLKKMKIFTEFGANLLGIIDYTGKLKEGEVYYSIDNHIWKPRYKENVFPFVAIIRKPALDHSKTVDLKKDFEDLKFFTINLEAFKNENPYKDLHNCIIFSRENKDFVLESCSSINLKRRSNYFQVFWDQHLLPERFKKTLEVRKDPKQLVPELLKEAKDIEDSQSFYFDRETQSTIKIEEEEDDEYNDSREIDKVSNSQVKFSNFKNDMTRAFLSLIKHPRLKDIKSLHLIYADTSGIRCGDLTARFLSECYRELCLSSPLKTYNETQVYYLLNILGSSRYLPVPSYNNEVKSSITIPAKSLLGKFYEIIMPLAFAPRDQIDVQKFQKNRINKDLIYKDFRKHLKHALKVLILYKYDIQKLCFLYGCSNEGQLFIGFNQENDYFSKNFEAPSFGREFINLKDYFRTLTKKYRQLFSQNLNCKFINGEAQIHPNNIEEAKSKASAWYVGSLYKFWKEDPVLKGLLEEADLKNLLEVLNEFEMNEIYGLPWVAAHDLLLQIKKDQGISKLLDESR